MKQAFFYKEINGSKEWEQTLIIWPLGYEDNRLIYIT